MSMWDDEAGYDLRDPKHPTYHDRMAFAADLARKRDKEYADETGAPLPAESGPIPAVDDEHPDNDLSDEVRDFLIGDE